MPDVTNLIDVENEVWKPVIGYENIYSVSSFGRVRRERSGQGSRVGKIVKPVVFDKKKGYHVLNLCRDCKCKTRLVHQLVAESFIGPCPDGMAIDHKDTCTTNNRVSNLQYLTYHDNSSHPGSKNGNAKLTEDDIAYIRKNYIPRNNSHRKLAKKFGVDHALIGRIIRKESWSHV
jgi:hypothetical protein